MILFSWKWYTCFFTFSLLGSLICHWPTYPSSSVCLDWSSFMVPVTCMCLPWPPMSDPFSGLFIDMGCLMCFPPLCCPLLPLYCPFLISLKLWLPVRAFVLVHVCPCVAGCVSSYEIYDAHLVFHCLSSKPLFFSFFNKKCIYTEQLTITVPALLAAGWFKACVVLKNIIDLGLKINYL